MRDYLPVLTLLQLPLLPSATRAEDAKAEKRFTVALNGKTWPQVFKWLSDVTGKPVIADYRPTGTCNVVTRPGSRHTLSEVIDLLNPELLGNNPREPHYLLPRERIIILRSLSEKIPGPAPRVKIEDLPSFPRTAPVTVEVVLPLKTRKAADLAQQVRKLLGPTGDVAAVEVVNQLLLQDHPRTLELIVKRLQKLDTTTKP
jgi:hypothetical protein